MAGLFDFLNSPAGMGLLSAVATGAAGARQGTPWNNVGRGAMGGLAGYANANDQIRQDEENAFQKQFRQTQMEQMQRQLADQQKMRESLQGLYKPAGTEQFQADNPFGEDLGKLQNETQATFGGKPVDPVMAAVLPYAQPDDILKMFGPQANENMFGKIMPDQYTPSSLAKYQQSKNFADLVPTGGNVNFGNVNPGQFTPASLAKYKQTGDYSDLVPFRAPTVINRGGQIDVRDSGTGAVDTFSVIPKITDTPDYIAAQEAAKTQAANEAKRRADQAARGEKLSTEAGTIDSLVAEADKLLNVATGSAAGAGVAYGKGLVGLSDESTQANAALTVLGGQLVSKIPRMEGPQSDADRKMYEQMAGRVADPKVPVDDRRAALRALQGITRQYADQQSTQAPKPAPAPATPLIQAQPMPAKPSPLTLKKGVVYQTPKGALRWNGKAFEDAQ